MVPHPLFGFGDLHRISGSGQYLPSRGSGYKAIGATRSSSCCGGISAPGGALAGAAFGGGDCANAAYRAYKKKAAKAALP